MSHFYRKIINLYSKQKCNNLFESVSETRYIIQLKPRELMDIIGNIKMRQIEEHSGHF
jgi:hypothetical protein